ncbi:SDR family oxidoreductase [Vineibacter terrae]|uniref:SDR family oxidoreductase n=1 Tax=Vineibacter terrae TaxID=2586908 RepID=A0A5C8PTS4_9HYPH|nr:SDR family oxidoreductase [Vineibacter terrae]TXL81728.1 SDR family oxidoreductase [Vineibacter terrae]
MAGDPFSLDGKVALITGANSGIGLALALALRDGGARVAIGGRRADRNADALAQLGPPAAAFALDVCDEGSVERAIAGAIERFGRLDVLVNNAGVSQRGSVMELDRATWQQVIDTNLTGAFLCTKHAARCMKAQGAGKIINVSSVYGLVAPSKGLQVAYTVAKHALIALTRVNAVELAPLGIQVNAVAPGWYFTEMTDELRGTAFETAVRRRVPAGRWGETHDLVGACRFLASAASDYVSGVVIPVDGGYVASDGLERT